MADQKYCPNCGTPNRPDAKFCAKCGGAFSALSSQHLSPQEAPYLEDEILNKIRGLLLPVTGKKILAGGVLLVLLIMIVSAMASPSNSGGGAGTVTPTLASTVAPTARVTVKATPTARATPSVKRLTQAQLDAGEASMTNDGYTITQHLAYKETYADGTLVYTGKMISPDGYDTAYQLMVYKDQTSADAGLTNSVGILQSMGFSGSYSDAYSWTGAMMSNGQALGSGAVESTGGSPYMVTVFFMSS